jgi:hypothetical protein
MFKNRGVSRLVILALGVSGLALLLWKPVLTDPAVPGTNPHVDPVPLATGFDSVRSVADAAAVQSQVSGSGSVEDASGETVIGYSQGGQPLVVHHLAAGRTVILLMGGQHGAPEANTVRLVRQLLSFFEERPDEIPAGIRLDIITEANPDGLAAGTRQFLSGVDPNRNWGGPDWASDAFDSNGLFRVGLGGSEPFSEPETQALRDYILAVRPALTINYHSRGGFLFGGRSELGTRLSALYASASGYGRPTATGSAGSALGYRATGSMNVWLAEQDLPGFLIELATSTDPEFQRNLGALKAVLNALAEGQ